MIILDHSGVELADHQEAAEYGRRLALREAQGSLPSDTSNIIVDDEFGTIFEFPSGDPWTVREDETAD